MRANRNLFLSCLTLGWSVTCHAGDTLMSGQPAPGPQIMIYFKQPLGKFKSPRVYGLRVDRTSSVSSSPASVTGPLRRREILDFEFAPHGDMHMAFGRRLFYDVGRNEFGLSPTHSTMMLNLSAPSSLALRPVTHHP